MDNKHEIIHSIFADAGKHGSLKESVIEHAAKYGVEEINLLFPDAKALDNEPLFLNNKVEWVDKVLKAVHKQPFSRVKTLMADISEDSARAKGYIKGNRKVEDVFSLLKRTTEPTTIYKKQKLDRDDIVDITNFDVVAWIKKEMRLKLDEELARAILIGDGRVASDNFKVSEDCIRPILNDDELYSIKVQVQNSDKYNNFIDACVRARKNYRGSGSPTLYTSEEVVAELLLIRDTTGNRIYKTEEDIKSVLRVSDIVTLNEFNGLVRTDSDGVEREVMGIIANLRDYAVGADRGGQVAMFDDFDIDYNQQKFLIEARCSGALYVPYSALVLELENATPSMAAQVEPAESTEE